MTIHKGADTAARAIRLAIQEGRFTREDVRRGLSDPPSASTITRVLRQLEESDWLSRTEAGSSIWRAGMSARALGDMSDRALEAANEPAVEPGGRPAGDDDDTPSFL